MVKGSCFTKEQLENLREGQAPNHQKRRQVREQYKEQVYNMRFKEKMSYTKIADEIGVSNVCIKNWVRDWGWPLVHHRPDFNGDKNPNYRGDLYSHITYDMLNELYVVQGLSGYICAEKLEMSHVRFYQMLRENNIKVRPSANVESVEKFSYPCDYCGKILYLSELAIAAYEKHFCPGSDCYGSWISENKCGENHVNWKGGIQPVPCSYCNKILYKTQASIRLYERHFCSDPDSNCFANWLSENTIGKDNHNYKNLDVSDAELVILYKDYSPPQMAELLNISRNTIIRRLQAAGAELRTASEATSGEFSSNWKGGAVKRICANPKCGKEFEIRPGSDQIYCSRKCQGEARRGENAPNWKGGVLAQRQRTYTRIKSDPKLLLRKRTSSAVRKSLIRGKMGKQTSEILGYSYDDLYQRLNKTIPSGYTWEDYNQGKLQLDHEIPIRAFNFTSPDDLDFKRCWALSNLRLIPKKENQSKGGKLYTPFQPNLNIGLMMD